MQETGDKIHPIGGGVPGGLARAGSGGDKEAGGCPGQAVRPGGERGPVSPLSASKCIVGQRKLFSFCQSDTRKH